LRTRNKLVRRIASTAASLAFAGGALLTAGGAAHAAALPTGARVPARTGAVVETVTADHRGGHHGHGWDRDRYERFYPWIWEQLKTFGYGPARP
jgi:hypothetical protein